MEDEKIYITNTLYIEIGFQEPYGWCYNAFEYDGFFNGKNHDEPNVEWRGFFCEEIDSKEDCIIHATHFFSDEY